MKFNYYYNCVPNKGYCRNNLIYTSLLSDNQKIFCQWFYNDKTYHKNQNQVVDPSLMDEKFKREVNGLNYMKNNGFGDMIPSFDINKKERKILLSVNGPDMWELAGCQGKDYSHVVPNWGEQMLDIIHAYKKIGMYKFSLHPSSYFVINGKLKSINYFFSYLDIYDKHITLESVFSHISKDRQKDLYEKTKKLGIDVTKPEPLSKIQLLAFESFKTNFNENIMEAAKEIYA